MYGRKKETSLVSYYKQLQYRKKIKERKLKDRSELIMGENFRFSKFLRLDMREKFLKNEEKIQSLINSIGNSKIEFKNRAGVILVDIVTPNGEIINDIIRKDSIDYNYCVNLLETALGIKEN